MSRKFRQRGAKQLRTRIGEQFAARPIKMLRSPSMRVLSLSGRRVLDRLEIELATHGGKDNGKLPVTFTDFCEFGIDRHCIAPAIRECVALGFLEVTQPGGLNVGEHWTTNLFRLTYQATERGDIEDKFPTKPTHEWKLLDTIEKAVEASRLARKGGVA